MAITTSGELIHPIVVSPRGKHPCQARFTTVDKVGNLMRYKGVAA